MQKNKNKILGLGLGVAALASFSLATTNSASASTKIDDNTVQVQSGDTLNKIAAEYNTDVQTLVSNNGIADANFILNGQTLKLNATSNAATANTQATVLAAQTTQAQPAASQTSVAQPAAEAAQATTDNTQAATPTAQTQATNTQATVLGGSDLNSPAANAISQAESGGDYNAQNGRYFGRWQMDSSYLNGDYSPANQDKTFLEYCNSRYGSVDAALQFREVHNWY